MSQNLEDIEKCSCRGRMVTDELYECICGPTVCPYMVSFGNGNFCTYRLTPRRGQTTHKITRSGDHRDDQNER